MDKIAATDETQQIRFISRRSPDYKREFINGAFINVTPRGEIVCDFHFESKDMPIEQLANIVEGESGQAKFSDPIDPMTFTRDTKFGIIINASLAKDLARLFNEKIKESENVIALREAAEKNNQGDQS